MRHDLDATGEADRGVGQDNAKRYDRIEAKVAQTPHWPDPHLCLFVNGVRLDELVARLLPTSDALVSRPKNMYHTES